MHHTVFTNCVIYIWPGLHCSAVWAGSRSLSDDFSPHPTSVMSVCSLRGSRINFARNSAGARPDKHFVNSCFFNNGAVEKVYFVSMSMLGTYISMFVQNTLFILMGN